MATSAMVALEAVGPPKGAAPPTACDEPRPDRPPIQPVCSAHSAATAGGPFAAAPRRSLRDGVHPNPNHSPSASEAAVTTPMNTNTTTLIGGRSADRRLRRLVPVDGEVARVGHVNPHRPRRAGREP